MNYCTNNTGLGTFKPSNIIFLAIQAQKGLSFGLKWKELEFLTRVMLSSGARLEVRILGGSIKLPRVTHTEVQCKIGAHLPEPHVGVVLYELAYKHNVIDFILYDMNAGSIYWIQVSSSPYSSKSKKKMNLNTDKVMDGRVILSSHNIANHYVPTVKFKEEFYIYATTNLTGWNTTAGVGFFNLLEFTPTDPFVS